MSLEDPTIAKLAAFMRVQLEDHGEGLRSFTLHHVQAGRVQPGNHLATKPVTPERPISDEWIKAAARQLVDAADNDCADRPSAGSGVQNYRVLADGSGRAPLGSHGFRLRSVDDSTVDSEPPTAEGVLAQVMRQNEYLGRQSAAVAQQTQAAMVFIMQTLRTELERTTEDNAKLRAELAAGRTAIEQAKNETIDRQVALLKANETTALMRRAADGLGKAWPLVVNAVVGSKVMPEDDPLRRAVLQFTDGFSDSEMEKLGEILGQSRVEQLVKLWGMAKPGGGPGPAPNGGTH